MRYILRIQTRLKARWDKVVPPRSKAAYLRAAVKEYLALPAQKLADRPRLANNKSYSNICFDLPDELVKKTKKKYPDTSLAVLLQAAVAHTIERKSYLRNPTFIKRKMPKRVPMRTRMMVGEITRLKSIGGEPVYGSLRSVAAKALTEFFEARPWKGKGSVWNRPAASTARGWRRLNVVLMPDLQKKVRLMARVLDVSVMTLLRSALVWWLNRHGARR